MQRLIDVDVLRERMYHDAFETDSDMQKWDSGCWIRYKMFENALEETPTVDAEPVKQERCEFCKDGKTFLGAVLVLGNDGNWHSIRYCPSCGAKMDAPTQKSVGNALEALDESTMGQVKPSDRERKEHAETN